MRLRQLFTIICILLIAVSISADVPNTINYQGRLTDASGDPVPDDTYSVTFTISAYVGVAGLIEIWDETTNITTKDGLFSHRLGTFDPLTFLTFRTGEQPQISVTVNSEVIQGGPFSSVPYAFIAERVETVYWSEITGTPEETGISQGSKTFGTTIPNDGSTMTDVITTTITTPAAGYIYLTAKCYVTHTGTTSSNYVYIQIDEEANGGTDSPHQLVGNSGYYSTTTHRFSSAVSRTYYKSTAGTYTFRLEALKTLTVGTSTIYYPNITAVYIPTSYGTVTTVASDPNGDPDAKMISITDEDGNTHTGYEIDLRNLELEVKEAALKLKEAELELLKAKQQNQ